MIEQLFYEIEHYFLSCGKTRAVQISNEKKILRLVEELRRSLESAADTGKEQSDAPAWP